MMGWRGKCEMSRSLVICTLEEQPHCKQLSGQDKRLGNFVARTKTVDEHLHDTNELTPRTITMSRTN